MNKEERSKRNIELALEYTHMVLEKNITRSEVALIVKKSVSHVQKTIKTYLDPNIPEHKILIDKLKIDTELRRDKNLLLTREYQAHKKSGSSKNLKLDASIKNIDDYFNKMCTGVSRDVAILEASQYFKNEYSDIEGQYNAWRKMYVGGIRK